MRHFERFDLMQSRPAIVMQYKKYSFVSNSSQIITDFGTVLTNGFLATQYARANAAAGPITDLPGMVASCKLRMQETAEILAYILEGSSVQTSLTAPAGGLVLTGDSNATTCWNLLTGIYQILK